MGTVVQGVFPAGHNNWHHRPAVEHPPPSHRDPGPVWQRRPQDRGSVQHNINFYAILVCSSFSFDSKLLSGPICTISCCGDVEFKVVSVQTGDQVGMITKQWSGMAKEAFTDADNFGISFPLDLDVKVGQNNPV